MKIWIITRDGIPDSITYRALSEACKVSGASYKLAAGLGQRLWIIKNQQIRISEATVQKMKSRGSKVGLRKFPKK